MGRPSRFPCKHELWKRTETAEDDTALTSSQDYQPGEFVMRDDPTCMYCQRESRPPVETLKAPIRDVIRAKK